MKIANHDLDEKVLIIAEIGNNHEGSFALAEELIHRAADAGADAVKFQTFRTEHYVSRRDAARFQRLKSFEFAPEQFARLAETTRAAGLLFISTPFDLASAEILAPLVAAYKIASGDNTFFPLLEAVARHGRPVLLSGGLADVRQLADSKHRIEQIWANQNLYQELAVLHCVTSYPVPPRHANLGAIRELRHELACTVGYSDHTLGVDAAVLSVALGARVIEKHFTIAKNYSDFRDHQLSADPAELRELVARVRAAETYLGDGRKVAQECELANEKAVRRSIAAACDLPAGTALRWEHLTWLRPAGGLAPGQEKLVLGQTLARHLEAGELITLDLLTQKQAA